MSDLSPERRELAVNVLRLGAVGGKTRGRLIVDALAPLIDRWLAAEREAGAAEVRARVEAAMDGWDHDRQPLVRYAERVIRAALNGGE